MNEGEGTAELPKTGREAGTFLTVNNSPFPDPGARTGRREACSKEGVLWAMGCRVRNGPYYSMVTLQGEG